MVLNEVHSEELKNDFYKSRYDKTCGAIYVAGYATGVVKIGSTSQPGNRFLQLCYSSIEYAGGRLTNFALSNPIREYTKLESVIHERFRLEHIRRELFRIDFNKAVKVINSEFRDFDKVRFSSKREFRCMKYFKELLDEYGSAENIPLREIKRMSTLAFEDGMDAFIAGIKAGSEKDAD